VRGDSRSSFQPGEDHCGEADLYLRDVSVSRLSAGFSRSYLNKKSRGREITGARAPDTHRFLSRARGSRRHAAVNKGVTVGVSDTYVLRRGNTGKAQRGQS